MPKCLSTINNPCPQYPDTKCVVYSGTFLSNLGVTTNERLESILHKINNAFGSVSPGGVTSFNGRIGAVTSEAGDYTTTIVAEGTHLYFTEDRAIDAITSGSFSNPSWITSLAWGKITGAPAFLTTEVDPVFTAHVAHSINSTDIAHWNSAYGFQITEGPFLVRDSRTLTINGVTQNLGADRSWTITANIPTLDQVLNAGDDAGGFSIHNLDQLEATTIDAASYIHTDGEIKTGQQGFIIDNGVYNIVTQADNLATNRNQQVADADGTPLFSINLNGNNYTANDQGYVDLGSAISSLSWGDIIGTLSDQTDLQNALNSKQNTITTGTALQYFRGNLSLATFPTNISSFINDLSNLTVSTGLQLNSGTTYNGSSAKTLSIGTSVVTLTGAQALSNKTGLISQWTNDSGYITSSGVTPAALTKTDDTNVTLTLGGSPSTALLQATSLTLGWTGTLADTRIASASTWNAKQNAITTGNTTQYFKGDLSLGTFPTDNTSFTNGAGYITTVALTNYVDKTISNTYTAGAKQIFTPNTTNVGLNVGAISATPSSLIGGDIFYNSTSGNIQYYDGVIASTRTLVTLSQTQTLTNKTIAAGSNTITGLTNSNLSGSAGITDANISSSTDWNTAYTNRITSLTVTGSSGASTLVSNVLNIPTYTLSGLGGTTLAAVNAQNLSVFAVTTSAQLRGILSDELGTGVALFDGATPTSFILTNATSLPVSTGISGLGSGVATFLATPSSANLATAITDETGSGSLVFATSPTFTTQITTPLIVGGTGTTSSITYKTTTGTGATGAAHIFQVGNNGATEAMRILNSGNVAIGAATAAEKFTVTTSGSNYGIIHTDGTVSVGTYTDGSRAYFGTKSNHAISIITNNSSSQTSFNTNGSVSIGNSSAAASAILDLTSTTRGFLVPRMTTTQMNAISSPATSLKLYNSTAGMELAYNGSAYVTPGHIAGSYSQVGTATTTFTVTFGGTQPNATYKVNVTPTSSLSAALFYVTNKTTTTFDVTYLAGLTGTVTFDYLITQ